MDKLKAILILLVVILGALGLLSLIGLVYTALGYILLFGVLCFIGYIGARLLLKGKSSKTDELESTRDLKKIDRTLEEYKRRLK